MKHVDIDDHTGHARTLSVSQNNKIIRKLNFMSIILYLLYKFTYYVLFIQ
jgi:hypothetical protein